MSVYKDHALDLAARHLSMMASSPSEKCCSINLQNCFTFPVPNKSTKDCRILPFSDLQPLLSHLCLSFESLCLLSLDSFQHFPSLFSLNFPLSYSPFQTCICMRALAGRSMFTRTNSLKCSGASQNHFPNFLLLKSAMRAQTSSFVRPDSSPYLLISSLFYMVLFFSTNSLQASGSPPKILDSLQIFPCLFPWCLFLFISLFKNWQI